MQYAFPYCVFFMLFKTHLSQSMHCKNGPPILHTVSLCSAWGKYKKNKCIMAWNKTAKCCKFAGNFRVG